MRNKQQARSQRLKATEARKKKAEAIIITYEGRPYFKVRSVSFFLPAFLPLISASPHAIREPTLVVETAVCLSLSRSLALSLSRSLALSLSRSLSLSLAVAFSDP